MAVGEEVHTLVEEREEEMVPFLGSKKPFSKKGWFLKPISTTKKISLSSSLASFHCNASKFTMIQFNGWVHKLKYWNNWVSKLKPIYSDLWKKVGIFDAIIASTYKFRRDPSSLLGVVRFWCEETNTFIFPWAEATVTLEDVMILGGFSVLGEPVRASNPLDGELGELECEMLREMKKFNRTKCKKADVSIWMKHYMEEGNGDELEHIAFLAMWLSRFVLLAPPARTIRQDVIPVAIRLARGERIALAPAVLASLYRDLRKMKGYLASNRTLKSPRLIVWAPFCILQLWVWERFIDLQPELSNFIDSDEPRAARWHDLGMKLEYKFVMSVIKSRDQVQWRPYMTSMDHWCRPSHYRDDSRWVSNNEVVDEGLESFAQCLRDCELVGLDCTEQYLPHRVARQFGLDQDIPCSVLHTNSTWEVAWATYDISQKSVKFYVPHRLSESDVTLLYSIWWESVRRLSRKNVNGKKGKKLESQWRCKKEKVQDGDGTTISDCLRREKKKVQYVDGITFSDCLAGRKKKKVQDSEDIRLSDCQVRVRRKKRKVQDSDDIRPSDCQVRVHRKKRRVQESVDITLSDHLVCLKKEKAQGIDDIPLSDRLACLKKKKVQDVDDIPLSDWLAHKERSISSKKPPKLPTGVTATQDHLACEKNMEKCFDLNQPLESSEAMKQDVDASNNVQVENGTGISNPLGTCDLSVAWDIKETSAGESVSDPILKQDLEETFDTEDVEESTGTEDRRPEDIEKLENTEKRVEQSLPLETSEAMKQDADSLSNVQVDNGAVISNLLSLDEGVVGVMKKISFEEFVYDSILMEDVEETSHIEVEEISGTKDRTSGNIEKLENTEKCVEQNLPFGTSETMKQDTDSLSNVQVENAVVIYNVLDINDEGVVGDIKETSAEESVYVLIKDVKETSYMEEVEESSGTKNRRSEDIEKLENTGKCVEQNLPFETSETTKRDVDSSSTVQADNGVLVSNPLIFDNMVVLGDIKETSGRGSVYDPILIEDLDETFDMEELDERTGTEDKRAEDIEMLKEEIVLIEARVKELESHV